MFILICFSPVVHVVENDSLHKLTMLKKPGGCVLLQEKINAF